MTAVAPAVPALTRLRSGLPGRVVQLMIGLTLYGAAIGLMVRGAIGLDPWSVFAQGLSRTVPISIGVLTVLIGAVVLLLWWPLRQKPGVGTVLNVLWVGPALDVTLLLVPQPTHLLWQIVSFASGLVLLGVATGVYLGARLGPGPRDGLMTGLARVTGRPIWQARTAVELTVLASGWALGGTVGVGTVAFALLVGPLCQFFIPRLRAPERA
jgi:uncharacterized membrane protein YczE